MVVKPISMARFTYILMMLMLFFPSVSASQEPGGGAPEKQEESVEITADVLEQSTFTTLNVVLDGIEDIQERIKEKSRELKRTRNKEEKIVLVREIEQLKQRMNELDKNFERISTGIDPEEFESRRSEEFEWKEEVQELLGPIIQELKNMTERPRQIEKLRSEVLYYQNQLQLIDKAIVNIDELSGKEKRKKLNRKLKEIQENWQQKRQQTENQLTVTRYQLDEKIKEKKSLFESTQNITRTFFKSRGKNILFSVLMALLVLVLLRMGHRLIYIISPWHKSGKRTFYIRMGDILYFFFTFLGTAGVMLITLYVSGDWVLLSIAVIFFLGIIWTAKQGLPIFWEQIKLLLNLGTVRENERLIYKGIPWRVVSINFYCKLDNPDLEIARIRLPLKALINFSSRPSSDDEPWFPCKIGDWVLLSDETFGKVIHQNPEMVQLILLGGSRKTYRTDLFLEMNPANLSTGFRINAVFGIDYAHQIHSTEEIPAILVKALKEKIGRTDYDLMLRNLRVEFKEAGASSLDLEILADFSGKAARYYQRLTRLLHRTSVDTCNLNGWVIPFTQITLHNAFDEKPETV